MDSLGRSDRSTIESLLFSSTVVRFSLRDPSSVSFVQEAISDRRVGRLRYVVDRASSSVSVDFSDLYPPPPRYVPLRSYPCVPTGGSPPHSFSALVEMSSFVRGALRVVDDGKRSTVTFMGLEADAVGGTRADRRVRASDRILSLYRERWSQGPCKICSSVLSHVDCKGCYHTDYMIRSMVNRVAAVTARIQLDSSRVSWYTIRGRMETPCRECFSIFSPDSFHPYSSVCKCDLCEYIKVLGLKTGRRLRDVLYDASDAYVLIQASNASASASAISEGPSSSGRGGACPPGPVRVCQSCGCSRTACPRQPELPRSGRSSSTLRFQEPTPPESSDSEVSFGSDWKVDKE